jgi:peptidylprolyl isomerase
MNATAPGHPTDQTLRSYSIGKLDDPETVVEFCKIEIKEFNRRDTSTGATTTPSGLVYRDIIRGTGKTAKPSQTCVVNYTGWLWDGTRKGKKFDSSFDRGEPFTFQLASHKVIAGWEEGVAAMHVGATRELIIPSHLAYGTRGAGGVIPPNATLFFEIELLKIK